MNKVENDRQFNYFTQRFDQKVEDKTDDEEYDEL
jgi:hypothetical protein